MKQAAIALGAICMLWAVGAPDCGAGEAPRFELVGTIKKAAGGIALCRDPSTGRVFSLRIGGLADGWTLRSVGSDRATFARESEATTLKILSPAGGAVVQP